MPLRNHTYVRLFKTLLIFILFYPAYVCSNEQSTIHHVVIVWFKDDINQTDLNDIFTEINKLKKIPGIISLHTGSPIASERPIVDDSFDMGIHMTFRTADEMNDYLQHPIHVAFINKWIKPVLKKILVYDFNDFR